MCFSLGDFLEDAQEGDGCKEEAGGIGSQWRRREGRRRIAEFVDFRAKRGWRWG